MIIPSGRVKVEREEVLWQESQPQGSFISALTAVIIHGIILQIQSYFAKLYFASWGYAQHYLTVASAGVHHQMAVH